jgi:hypothetical protein
MHQAVVKGGQREFNIAMIDALNAPVVESIQAENYQGHADDQIIIRAKDDFKIVAVLDSIFNQAGDLIEEGNAIIQNDEEMKWLYKAQQENPGHVGSKIIAVASDLPGNNGLLSLFVS